MALYILPCLDANKRLTKMQAQRLNNETVTLLNFKTQTLTIMRNKKNSTYQTLKITSKKCKNNIMDTRKS